MNKIEIIELINRKQVVYLATVNEEGYPRVRPLSVVKIRDGKVYIFTGSFNKQKSENNQYQWRAWISKKATGTRNQRGTRN